MQSVLIKAFFMIFLAEMGDKSQFLMVAMSAEYRLREMIGGIAAAIGSLNLIAVLLGGAIGELLPMPLISTVAGLAFLCFAYMGLGDGEAGEASFRSRRSAFLTVFGTYFLAELGDKTQLTTLMLAAEGGGRGAWFGGVVLVGAVLALLTADMIGILVGAVLGKHLPRRVFAGLSFLIFAVCGAVRLLEGVQGFLNSHPHGVPLSAAITSAVMLLFLGLVIKRHGRRKTNDTGTKQSVSVQ